LLFDTDLPVGEQHPHPKAYRQSASPTEDIDAINDAYRTGLTAEPLYRLQKMPTVQKQLLDMSFMLPRKRSGFGLSGVTGDATDRERKSSDSDLSYERSKENSIIASLISSRIALTDMSCRYH
jgi:hypothetical protein